MSYSPTYGYYFLDNVEDKEEIKKLKKYGHCFPTLNISKLLDKCFVTVEEGDKDLFTELLNERYERTLDNGAVVTLRYIFDGRNYDEIDFGILCTVLFEGREYNIVYTESASTWNYKLSSYISDISELMKTCRYLEEDDEFPNGFYINYYGPCYNVVNPEEFNVYKALNSYKKSYKERKNQITRDDFLRLYEKYWKEEFYESSFEAVG